jgi:hypothetical protein
VKNFTPVKNQGKCEREKKGISTSHIGRSCQKLSKNYVEC